MTFIYNLNFKIFNGQTLLMETVKTKSFSLKPGSYDITMISVQGGLVKYTQKIEVKAGEKTPLAVPPMGFLSIRSDPSNCKVIIDDNYEATPPFNDLPLQPGKHRIFIEWRTLEVEDEITIDIHDNQKKKLRGFVNNNSYGISEE